MSKAKNWFEELPPEKQNEYCSRLQGKRRSKYCTIDGKPKAGMKSLTVVPEPVLTEIPASMAETEEIKQLLEAGLIKPEDVMKEQEKEYYDFDSSYEWAKKSEISNLGEDLAGSARHSRNALKNWEEKDLLINLNIKMNRKALEKKNCPDFASVEDKDLMKAFALREALNEFPATVPAGNDQDDKDLLLERRRIYLDGYNGIVNKIKKLMADPSIDSLGALQLMEAYYRELYLENRDGESRLFGDAMYAKYRRMRGTNGPMSKLRGALRKMMMEKGETNQWAAPNYKLELDANNKKFIKNLISGKEKLVARRAPVKNGLDEKDIYKNNKNFTIEGTHKTKDNEDAVKFMKRFARGVQFGNAMPDDERKVHLVAAAKSLEDLSSLTGVSIPTLLHDGKVGLAFGARGRSMAAAHYESGQKVINMTRSAGYGSLAHELGHALDHHAAEIMNKPSYLSKDYRGAGDSSDPVEKSFDGVSKTIQAIQKRIIQSDTYRNMRPKQRAYWTSKHEIFARLFEGYVDRKLSKSGKKNSYLVKVPEGSTLWPNEEELANVESDLETFLSSYERAASKKRS